MMAPPSKEGLFVVDKQPGPTSFDIVRQMKRVFPGAKIGHTGSLDPFASGVLVLLVGRATKLSNALLNADKRYRATVFLGSSTDSMDRTGKVTQTSEVPELTQEHIESVIKGFVGEWNQVPPMYSAKKVQGVRLYELARQNISVERQSVAVQLYEMKLVRWESPWLEFDVHCSKGTYVRSLAHELGARLGTEAHLHDLRRTTCGEFTLEDAVSLDALSKEKEKCVEQGFKNYLRLLRSEAKWNGQPKRLAQPHLQMPFRSGNSFVN